MDSLFNIYKAFSPPQTGGGDAILGFLLGGKYPKFFAWGVGESTPEFFVLVTQKGGKQWSKRDSVWGESTRDFSSGAQVPQFKNKKKALYIYAYIILETRHTHSDTHTVLGPLSRPT